MANIYIYSIRERQKEKKKRKKRKNSLASFQQCTWRPHRTNIRGTSFRHVKKHLGTTIIPQLPSRSNIRRVPFFVRVERQYKIEEWLGNGFSECCNTDICSTHPKKKKVNEKNTATTVKGEIVRTTPENRSESLHHGDRVVQRFHPGKKIRQTYK